ncbi:MAG: PAS domain S-box protein [Candidatus Eisenbacteria bacterium]
MSRRHPDSIDSRRPAPSRPGSNAADELRDELALANAACGDAERRYTALFDGSRDAIVVVDREGTLVEANAAALTLWGRARREMLGIDCRSLLQDQSVVEELLRQTRDGGTACIECRALRSDGSHVACLVSASARTSESGRITGFQAIIHDVTERCAAMEALRKSEEMYRSLFEESQDVVYITSCDGGLIDISPSASTLFGRSKPELLEMDVRELYAYPDDRRRFQKEIERSGSVGGFPVRLKNSDGSVRHCLLTSTVRRGADGETIGYHGIMRDVTDQRRADRARERERVAFRVMAEASVRADGAADLCSRVLEGLLNTYRLDFGTVRLFDESTRQLNVVAVSGVDDSHADLICSQDIDDAGTTAALVARTGRGIFAPDVNAHALASTHAERLKRLDVRALVSNPLVGQRGELVGVLQLAARTPVELGPEDESVLLTVAEMFAAVIGRALALEEKDEIHAQLLQAQKMEAVGTLASGVAHDFNNILTAIQGFADLALMSVDEDGQLTEDLERIRGSAVRGAKLVRQLLTFSRRQPVEFGAIDLNSATQGLMRMLAPLIGEDVSMSVVLERDVWTVTADEAGMQQVLMNLAVNARDAMPDGGTLTLRTENVTLTEDDIRAMPGASAGTFVRLSVSDTGLGMDEETQRRAFEPFFSTKGPAKGTGLGLSVVYGIVQQHRGWVSVDSRPDEGTTFSVYLPAARGSADERRPQGAASDGARGNGERILVVEDERTVRDLAARVLRQGGYEVLEASTVRDALAIIDREDGRFDLVFSDVVLPDESGVQLAQKLSVDHPDVPVLLSSGHADERSQYDAIREGGMPFLPKPYTLPDLLKAVRRIVSPS